MSATLFDCERALRGAMNVDKGTTNDDYYGDCVEYVNEYDI